MQPRITDQQSGWPLLIKVILDRLVAALLLVVLSPVLLIVAFLVWFHLGRPIFYRQTRPGRTCETVHNREIPHNETGR